MSKITTLTFCSLAAFALAHADTRIDPLSIRDASQISFGQFQYSERGLSVCYTPGFDARELLRILATASPSDDLPSLFTHDASTGFITIRGVRYTIHFPQLETDTKSYLFTISGSAALPVSYRLAHDQAELLRRILPPNSHQAPLQ